MTTPEAQACNVEALLASALFSPPPVCARKRHSLPSWFLLCAERANAEQGVRGEGNCKEQSLSRRASCNVRAGLYTGGMKAIGAHREPKVYCKIHIGERYVACR